VLYVFVTKTESGGQFWRVLFNRMLFGCLLSNVIVALMIYARKGGTGIEWRTMLACLAPLPIILILFKIVCARQFDDRIHYYTRGPISEESIAKLENLSRSSDRVGIRFGHPALYQPLTTPLVHSKAQHMLSKVYHGRVDEDDYDDNHSMAGYSDSYSMRNLNNYHKRKNSKAPKKGLFEFVNETDLDFGNFKDRPEFRAEHGGAGEMYGKPEDLMNRAGTPISRTGTPAQSGLRTASGHSDKTFTNEAALPGTVYPTGYTPAMRGYSPSPDRGSTRDASPVYPQAQQSSLVNHAAPMGTGRRQMHRMDSAEEAFLRGRQP